MNDIKEIIARLKENDRITRKFTEVETSIINILNFKDLFEALLTQIQSKFSVPYAWITVVDKCEISRLLDEAKLSDFLKDRLNIINRDNLNRIVGKPKKCILINNNLKPYFKLLPKQQKYFMKSLAIVPLFLDGELIGTLNQADFSKHRFKPGIDISSLDQLGQKVSLCLSNVTAHQNLRFQKFHDPLTGFLKGHLLKSVLTREFSKAKRYNTSLSIAQIVFDQLKKVNDALGHELGDEVLLYIADQLKQKVRNNDILFRFGIDSFTLILPNTNAASTERLLLRFQRWLAENPFRRNRGFLPLAINFALVSSEMNEIKTPEEILSKLSERILDKKYSPLKIVYSKEQKK